LYNVHGNVWEWTSDCWRRPEAGSDRAVQCAERVAKGGSWNDWADFARSSARIGFLSTGRNAMQGFRIARDLP
jgi:formylglycine-generating enzyme required for sulfatase activity